MKGDSEHYELAVYVVSCWLCIVMVGWTESCCTLIMLGTSVMFGLCATLR